MKMERKKTVKDLGIAVGVSFFVTVLFLMMVAFFVLKSGWSEMLVSKIMIAGYVLAPGVGGFLLGKKRKVNRFLWGLSVGMIYFLIYGVLAVCTKDVSFGAVLWAALPMCFGGMAGGMLS